MMAHEHRKQRELETRYDELKKEIERRGGIHEEPQPNMLPLEVKVEFLEHVLRHDDAIKGKRA